MLVVVRVCLLHGLQQDDCGGIGRNGGCIGRNITCIGCKSTLQNTNRRAAVICDCDEISKRCLVSRDSSLECCNQRVLLRNYLIKLIDGTLDRKEIAVILKVTHFFLE